MKADTIHNFLVESDGFRAPLQQNSQGEYVVRHRKAYLACAIAFIDLDRDNLSRQFGSV